MASFLSFRRSLGSGRDLGGIEVRPRSLWTRRWFALAGALSIVVPLALIEFTARRNARSQFLQFCGYDTPGFIDPAACANPPEVLPVVGLSLLAAVVGAAVLTALALWLGRRRGAVSVNAHRVRIGRHEVPLSDLESVEVHSRGFWVWQVQDLVLTRSDETVIRVAMDGVPLGDLHDLAREIDSMRVVAVEGGSADDLPEDLQRLRVRHATEGPAG